MDRSRYPQNWAELSHRVKESADWHCQDCGRPCRRPGERWLDFANTLIDSGWSLDLDKPQRFTLTTAHLNQDPSDSSATNLRALCAPCHLAYDRPFRLHNRARKQERRGQQRFEGV